MTYKSSTIVSLNAAQNGFESSIRVAGTFGFFVSKIISTLSPASLAHRFN